jgi:hypothetical protein
MPKEAKNALRMIKASQGTLAFVYAPLADLLPPVSGMTTCKIISKMSNIKILN